MMYNDELEENRNKFVQKFNFLNTIMDTFLIEIQIVKIGSKEK